MTTIKSVVAALPEAVTTGCRVVVVHAASTWYGRYSHLRATVEVNVDAIEHDGVSVGFAVAHEFGHRFLALTNQAAGGWQEEVDATRWAISQGWLP